MTTMHSLNVEGVEVWFVKTPPIIRLPHSRFIKHKELIDVLKNNDILDVGYCPEDAYRWIELSIIFVEAKPSRYRIATSEWAEFINRCRAYPEYDWLKEGF